MGEGGRLSSGRQRTAFYQVSWKGVAVVDKASFGDFCEKSNEMLN